MTCPQCANAVRLTALDSPSFVEGSIYLCDQCGERLLYQEGKLIPQGKREVGGIEAAVNRATDQRIAAASPRWDSDERQWVY